MRASRKRTNADTSGQRDELAAYRQNVMGAFLSQLPGVEQLELIASIDGVLLAQVAHYYVMLANLRDNADFQLEQDIAFMRANCFFA